MIYNSNDNEEKKKSDYKSGEKCKMIMYHANTQPPIYEF